MRTGGDTLLNDDTIRNGNRLVTKLWNAAKLALGHLDDFQPPASAPGTLNATDRWLLARLHETIRRATRAMDEYEFASAKAEVERFFWSDFADNYLELVKFRLYGSEAPDDDGSARANAQYVLYHTLKSVIGMLAPFMPHITDEIYLRGFGEQDGCKSVHVLRMAGRRWMPGRTTLRCARVATCWASPTKCASGRASGSWACRRR